MVTKESIYVILFSLPVYQLLFYTVQLVSFKRRNPSKKYLGLLMLSMTTFLIINAIHFLGYSKTFSWLYLIYLPVLLSIAPAYFLYILSITRENHDVRKRQRFILFLPAILFFILNIFILGSMDPAARLSLVDQDIFINGSESSDKIPVLIGFWIGAIVLVFAQIFFIIQKVSKIMLIEADVMRRQPTHLAYLEWQWVLGISISVLIFLVINVLIEMIVPMKHMGLVVVYNLLMLVTGGVTGYLGMKQDTLLNQVEKISWTPEPKEMESVGFSDEKADDGNLPGFISQEEAVEIKNQIINYLEKERPYTNTDFSMYDLCTNLNVSRRKISFVLNEVIRKNFYGVINEYRVKDAEELLLKEDLNQMKIETLGEMVGFQSKSSFNACFKKVTGMTPSEYRLKKKLT
jgi:AraC-like DNA-binding protein